MRHADGSQAPSAPLHMERWKPYPVSPPSTSTWTNFWAEPAFDSILSVMTMPLTRFCLPHPSKHPNVLETTFYGTPLNSLPSQLRNNVPLLPLSDSTPLTL